MRGNRTGWRRKVPDCCWADNVESEEVVTEWKKRDSEAQSIVAPYSALPVHYVQSDVDCSKPQQQNKRETGREEEVM